MGQFIHEDDIVGQPPFRDPALEEGEQRFPVQAAFGPPDDDEQGPLVPFRVRYADGRRLDYIGMGDRRVLQFDRADPLAPDLITSLLRSVICM